MPDPATLARVAAEHFAALASAAIAARRRFVVALSGGETPRATYAELGGPDFRGRVDWPHVHVFWGDERCVPPDHPDSNYHMARETLLDRVPIPPGNIHRMTGEMEPDDAAADYELCLRLFFGIPVDGARPPSAASGSRRGPPGLSAGRAHHRRENGGYETRLCPDPPRFDLILLGLGADGHTASLFPGTPALQERRRWVVAHYVPAVRAWRLTLTLPVINGAAEVTFLVAGQSKAERLRQVLAGACCKAKRRSPCALPARMIRPADGRLLWLADAQAASLLQT